MPKQPDESKGKFDDELEPRWSLLRKTNTEVLRFKDCNVIRAYGVTFNKVDYVLNVKNEEKKNKEHKKEKK